MAHTAHKDPEMLVEHEEDDEVLDEKAKLMASWIQNAKHFIVFTGAGISTSAGIPDFRGPEGVWTLSATGGKRTKPTTSFLKAVPTATHMAIVSLMQSGLCKFLISQNVDGLHRKSGIAPQSLAELHGNTNLEICKRCGKQYVRDFDVSAHVSKSVHDHLTGRKCSVPNCGGDLYDSIINFGESLPERDLRAGFDNATQSDLCLVLGSSLTVTPAADMPKTVAKNQGGKLVIVNMQKTPHDSKAALRVFAKCDEFMKKVMKYLELPIPEWRLSRRLIVENSYDEQKKKYVMRLQGIDVDNTPVSFIRSVTCSHTEQKSSWNLFSSGQVRETLNKEPFIHTSNDETEVTFLLEFMGHYNEPNLEIKHNATQKDCKMYSLEYNPFTGEWKTSVADAKPFDFTSVPSTENKNEVEEKKPENRNGLPTDMSNMFVVEPRDDCTHLGEFFKKDKIPIGVLATGIMNLPCDKCQDTNENWICLECYKIGCSRYVKSHQEAHYKETGHCIAASFSDLSVWCYKCDSYIKDYSLRPFLKMLSDIKFGPEDGPIIVRLNGQDVVIQRSEK